MIPFKIIFLIILLADDTSKEAENTKTEQNRYRTTAEENKYDLGQEGTNYSQRFLSRASRQNSSSGFETSLQKEQPYQSVQPSSSTELGYGNSSGNSYEASNKNEKQDSLNDYNNGQSNTYPNYYGNEPKSSSDLTHQEQQPPPHDPLQSFNQQKSPHQEQISFQEQEKLLQEQDKLQQEQQFNQPQQPQPKQQSSYQDDPTYREQLSHQEQPHFQEETFQQPQKPNDSLSYEELSSGDKTEESQDSNLAGSLQPSVTSHVEPTESLPPEPIPPPAEVPKTTASQRFQRAAELSRQSSRSDDITRGKLSPAQARARNSLMSRNQTKPQSRFK